MKRWRSDLAGTVENVKIDAFLEEVWAVCERHGLALSHQDGHGSFEVVSIEDGSREWIMEACDCTRPQP